MKRTWSRRRFMATTAAAGVSATAGATLRARDVRAADETPKKGGLLKLGLGGASTTDSMDPTTTQNSAGAVQNFQTYNCLVEVDAQGRAIPELAETWSSNDAADDWTFDLRKGVEFHDGKTLTADDVVYSIKRHLAADSKSGAKGFLTDIREIKADGPTRVAISLNGGNLDLPYIFGDYHLGIVREGFTDWAKPVGTGPFVMKHYEPGVRSSGERHANYFKDGRPYADAVEVADINDSTARLNALRSGGVHIVNRVDSRVADMLKEVENVEVVASPGRTHFCFVMDTRKPPLSDNNVRLAFKYAIDRENILKTVLRGYGRIGNDHSVPESDPFFRQLPQHSYDPDKARFHLKKAGHSELSIDLSTAEGVFQGAVDMAVLFQQSAKAAGINVNVLRESNDGYWDNIWLKKPFYMSWFGGRPTADMMLSLAYKSDSSWNDTFWSNPEFDKLLLSARAMADEGKRSEMFGEMQRLIWDTGGYIIPVFGDSIDAHLAKARGLKPNPNAELMGLRCSESVWLEA